MQAGFSLTRIQNKVVSTFLAVPVRMKIMGIMMLPVLILGGALTYWIRTGLSDWLSYLLSDERVLIAMRNGSRSVMIVTILAAIISMLLAYLLMLILTKPLLELRRVALNVANGDLTSRTPIEAMDEIGEVSQAVNLMIDRLVVNQQKLRRSNRRLEAINRVITAASKESVLQEVLDAALTTTLTVMNRESGWILLKDPMDISSDSFHLASHFGLDDALTRRLREVNGSDCLCRETLRNNDLHQGASRHRCLDMPDEKGRPLSHISIPLAGRKETFGVMNLIWPSSERVSDDDLELLTTIGSHLSEIAANAQLHASLVEKEAIRQALLQALVEAQEGERANLARELHDGAGQTLTSLMVRLKILEKRALAEGLQEEVAILCDFVSETIEQIRGLAYQLRPSSLEQFGLPVALRTLMEDMIIPAGLTTDINLNAAELRLPFEVETTLYRIAQECMTNIIRHARATHVRMELFVEPNAISLLVEDDGCGFNPKTISKKDKQPRFGLLSMQERAEMLNGTLTVRSAPDGGTSVRVQIPIIMEEII